MFVATALGTPMICRHNDTNVAALARATRGSQQTGGTFQIVLYVRGAGTTGLKLETWIEKATGFGVDDNIRSAYQFIAQNYISAIR